MLEVICMDKGRTFDVPEVEWKEITTDTILEMLKKWEYDEPNTPVLYIPGRMWEIGRWERPLLGRLAIIRTEELNKNLLAVVPFAAGNPVHVVRDGDYMAFLDIDIKYLVSRKTA